MQKIMFGRKKFSLIKGKPVLKSTSFTVKTLVGEDERAFTERLLRLCDQCAATVEIVFKKGRPDYAVVTITGPESVVEFSERTSVIAS